MMRALKGSRTLAPIAALAALGLVVTGCSSSTSAGPTTTTPATAGSTAPSTAPTSAPAINGTIVVFAAASLTGTFTAMAKAFEALHPGTTVTLSFGGSSDLATSIDAGAPGDVFAAASTKTMQTVVAAGNTTSTPADFARNIMEIATEPGNPKKITSVADLAKSGIKVALCQAAVPCGAAATAVFKAAKVTVTPVTYEADVKTTLVKVTSGEVDAGVVYVTDVKAAGAKVAGVPIPAAVNFVTHYPIATLKQSKNTATATAFVDYVQSGAGLAVLSAAGFMTP